MSAPRSIQQWRSTIPSMSSTQTQTTHQINNTSSNPNPSPTPWQRRPLTGWRNYGAKNFSFNHLAAHDSWRVRLADGSSRIVKTEEIAGECPMPPQLHKGIVRVHAVFEAVDGGEILARGHVNDAYGASAILAAVPIGKSWAQVELAAVRYHRDLITEAAADCRAQERAELRTELRAKRAALQAALKPQN